MENFESKMFAAANKEEEKTAEKNPIETPASKSKNITIEEKPSSILGAKEQLDKLQTEKERPSKLSLLQVEPTTRCNLDCVYCARKRLIKSGEIEVDDIETE